MGQGFWTFLELVVNVTSQFLINAFSIHRVTGGELEAGIDVKKWIFFTIYIRG